MIGHVVELWRYPVKSMAAEALARVEVGPHGFIGDRRWAFTRDGANPDGFPWLTLRDNAGMRDYRPSFAEPSSPDSSATLVTTPGGAVLDVADPALASELWPSGATAVRRDQGAFDAFPLSLISTQSIERIGETVGQSLETSRFRPNIVMKSDDDDAFIEDSLVGAVLRIGTLRLRIDKRDGRCVVITMDPKTGQRNPAVLRAVAQDRDGCLGVYGSVLEPGVVVVGDRVHLESRPE